MKAKWEEMGEETRETKTDEERGRGWIVAYRDATNDTTLHVTYPGKNNKHAKTKSKRWTSKLINWKLWMLQVCGRVDLLAMIYPLLNNAHTIQYFSSCIYYSFVWNPHRISIDKLCIDPIRRLFRQKPGRQIDYPQESCCFVSHCLWFGGWDGWGGVLKMRWEAFISGNPSQAGGVTEEFQLSIYSEWYKTLHYLFQAAAMVDAHYKAWTFLFPIKA